MINKNQRKIIALILLIFSLFMIINSPNAATLSQAQIDNTPSGDTISLNPMDGEFTIDSALLSEGITITNKNITIKSSSQTQNAVINLNQLGRAFNITYTGNLKLINITIKNGTHDDYGGVIHNGGTANLTGCTFTGNTANQRGGAIYNARGGIANLTGCTFTGNTANYGGAVCNYRGTVTLTKCTFTGNTANDGGAIYNYPSATLGADTCTFTGNTAIRGGAVSNDGTATLTGCTFTGNTANYGGAIINFIDSTINVKYSVFYNNIGDKTVSIGTSSCDLNDNFYFWVNPDLNSMDSLKSAITNEPGIITTFYYLTITNTTIPLAGKTVNIRSLLSYYDGSTENKGVPGTELPDLDITLEYDGQKIDYNYKGETIPITMVSLGSNVVEFYYEDFLIYQLDLTVLDYSGLNAAIDSVNSKSANSYTVASWTDFQNALQLVLNDAEAMNNDKDAGSQDDIDALTNALNNAINSLVLNKVSTSGTTSAGSGYGFTGSSNTVSTFTNSNNGLNNDNSITEPKPQPTKHNANLKTTKVKRLGNSYKVTIKNYGKEKSAKTKLKMACPCGKFVKIVNVKAIGAGKSITIPVKFFKYSKTKHHNIYVYIKQGKVYKKLYKIAKI